MALTQPTTYYVKLNGKGGFATVEITGVYSYSRVSSTNIPDYLYRDTGYVTTDVNYTNTSGVNANSPLAEDDIYTHTAPRQATKDRYAHVFVDNTAGTPLVCGFFWDDYVLGVTNSNA